MRLAPLVRSAPLRPLKHQKQHGLLRPSKKRQPRLPHASLMTVVDMTSGIKIHKSPT
jgi:hypothetical protein